MYSITGAELRNDKRWCNGYTTYLLPQQQSASATPQRLCCRNSSLRVRRRNVSAAATAVCKCDAATSLLPQQQCANVTPQRLCCRNSGLRV